MGIERPQARLPLRLPAEEAAGPLHALRGGHCAWAPLGGALGQERGQCRPAPAASTLKGSGQQLRVRHKQLKSCTSETSLSVPTAGQGSVNLLHLIGVLSQLRSVEDAAPNWSRDDEVVRLGRENLNWSINVRMSRKADVAEETDPAGACPEDASVLLGDELAQSKNGRVHTSVSKISPSLQK